VLFVVCFSVCIIFVGIIFNTYMHMCVGGIDFTSVSTIFFLLDIGIVRTVWYFLLVYQFISCLYKHFNIRTIAGAVVVVIVW
jgi:hypothetical protein